jgi:hypothetical protein
MTDFNTAYNNDKQFKEKVITDSVTPDKQEVYLLAVSGSLDDFLGVAEAYKVGVIQDEADVKEQLRVFLEEYTVKLLNLAKDGE